MRHDTTIARWKRSAAAWGLHNPTIRHRQGYRSGQKRPTNQPITAFYGGSAAARRSRLPSRCGLLTKLKHKTFGQPTEKPIVFTIKHHQNGTRKEKNPKMSLNLAKYKLLSFDIYGTLIDWESGIYSDLQPLIDRLPEDNQYRSRKLILGAYSAHEQTIHREHPTMLYPDVLKECYRRLAAELSAGIAETEIEEEARTLSQGIGSWPAYPDTVQAMQTLGAHYKLVVLSNVDKSSFHRTLTGPLAGVHFDAIYTAQDIGSYKPDLKNFQYLINHVTSDLGVEKEAILHVAQSLTHDHVPAKSIGLDPGVWISRGGGEGKGSAMGGSLEVLSGEGKVRLGAVYETLGDFARAVEKAFAGER